MEIQKKGGEKEEFYADIFSSSTQQQEAAAMFVDGCVCVCKEKVFCVFLFGLVSRRWKQQQQQ